MKPRDVNKEGTLIGSQKKELTPASAVMQPHRCRAALFPETLSASPSVAVSDADGVTSLARQLSARIGRNASRLGG